MVYPQFPFTDTFDISALINSNNFNNQDTIKCLRNTLEWLCKTPRIMSFRVNTLKYTTAQVKELIEYQLFEILKRNDVRCFIPELIPDAILIESVYNDEVSIKRKRSEVIVDSICGAAVLRGANIFASGVMAMQKGMKLDDEVSVYADIMRKCKRGLPRLYECPSKVFLGNGIIQMTREQIFGDFPTPNGVAVKIIETISNCPNLNETCLPSGSALLQNVPSIVCGWALNPQPGDVVLDMCAAPGNKTTHLAALMRNEGTLIAIDKTPNKIKQLRKKCAEYLVNCVHIFEYDSTKCCLEIVDDKNDLVNSCLNGPPFLPETFDKILLDAPCSGLGNRPQLANSITNKLVKSYAPLQRKLFRNAVRLLKLAGILVYSTCTINVEENEGIVTWALETFNSVLELVPIHPELGGPGWPGTTLTPEQVGLVQRFGPEQEIDSIGFFIARFQKKM